MWIYYLTLLILIFCQVLGDRAVKTRQRRYLIFTKDTQYGAFATISIPLPSPETTVSVAWFLEANYYNVDNSSYFEPLLGDIVTTSREREKRNVEENNGLTRKRVYLFIEAMLEKHGFNGHECLLRAICENTTSHCLHNGVLGDIFHLLFTPSTSISEEDLDDCYYEAEYLGLEDQCDYYYDDCPVSPMDYISFSV